MGDQKEEKKLVNFHQMELDDRILKVNTCYRYNMININITLKYTTQ